MPSFVPQYAKEATQPRFLSQEQTKVQRLAWPLAWAMSQGHGTWAMSQGHEPWAMGQCPLGIGHGPNQSHSHWNHFHGTAQKIIIERSRYSMKMAFSLGEWVKGTMGVKCSSFRSHLSVKHHSIDVNPTARHAPLLRCEAHPKNRNKRLFTQFYCTTVPISSAEAYRIYRFKSYNFK